MHIAQKAIVCNKCHFQWTLFGSFPFFFFLREFQLMASAHDNNSLLSDQDTN